MVLMRIHIAAIAAVLCAARVASAQSAAAEIARGDSAYAALNAKGALVYYQKAITLDSTNAEALWKAAREAVDLGEAAGFANQNQARDSLFKLGEQYATRSVQANPNLAVTHFTMAKALGRAALSMGSRDRVKYAGRVRDQALAA
ncbi:MAG: hypothetical protein B7Z72_03955, partial [Gemmatimonadetes bacterium 21-71-4]